MICVIIIKHTKFSYCSIESQLLSLNPVHQPAAINSMHLQSTYALLTAPFQSEAHLESSETYAVELFCKNSWHF